MSSHEYLLEILAEEIPAWMLRSRIETIRESISAALKNAFGEAVTSAPFVDATSRRIVVHIEGIPESQSDREEEVKGPPRKMAYDADGTPTKALLGFLKKNDASLESVLPGEDEYVRLRRVVKGRSAKEILQAAIPPVFTGLRWPKMMRWGTGEQSWIRPVHSVISLFDGEPLPIEMFGVTSSNATVGHRTLSNSPITVRSFADYDQQLRAAHVVIRADERVAAMRDAASKLSAEAGGSPAADESIWEQWRYLSEAPGLVRAEFREEYLSLPEEVLVTVMRVHQKQLPVKTRDGLTNHFLALIDQTGDPDGNAATGNAFVTNARFADARFFYETDRRRNLESRIGELEHLQFHEKLGDYAKKSQRIERITLEICRRTGRSGNDAALAARLCKTDLVTEMVKEFTDLQGKVGGIYAREEGLPDLVWQAIYDHYLPANAEDPLPRGEAGAIVGLADRIDTLCGFFILGLRPTGSRDPFALRRAAQGAVLILLNRAGWDIPIGVDALIDIGLEAYQAGGETGNAVRGDLLEFFAERVRTILEAEPFSFAYDEIAAAMEAGWASSLTDLHDRVAALHAIRNRPEFLSLLDSAKRIANITAGAPGGSVSASLLGEPSERRLHELGSLVGEQIGELVASRDYVTALESFAGLAGDLESFFKDVMVMVDDERVRKNRIALLLTVGSLARRIADVTKIVVSRRNYDDN